MSAIVSDSNKVFQATNNSAFYGNSFTASGWYKITSDPNDYAYLFGNNNGASNGWELLTSQGTGSSDLKVQSRVATGTLYNVLDTTARTLNTWNFIAITFNSSTNELKLYWGNETTSPALIATTTTTGTMGSDTTALGFGYSAADVTAIRTQRISDLRIYNATVRTLTQIQSDYLTRLIGTETGLTDYWKFDETSGNTASNSTSARNATATAASWATSDNPAFANSTTTSTTTSTSTTSTSTSTTSTSTSTTMTTSSTSTTSTSTSTTSTSSSTTSTSTTSTSSSTTSTSTTTTLAYFYSIEGA